MKKAAEKSGIMTVPFKNKKLQLDIENRLQKYITDAEKQGVDLDMVSNENLKYTVNLNENVDPISRAISADSPQGKAITEKLFGKKSEVVSFKDKIEAMKKSGDIVDPNNLKKNENVRTRELFKDSNLNKPTIEGQMEKITGASNKIKEIQKEIDNMYKPKSDVNQRLKGPIKEKQDMGPFGKVDVETDYSSSINRPEFFDPKAKNMFGKTVKTGVEFIQKEKERILNLINNKKKNMVPPTHSNYKLLKKSLQDQEDALEAIKITEDLGGNENMFDFLRTENISDYSSKPLKRSNYTKTDAEIKAEIEAGNKKGIESLKNKKDDPEGFYTGGIVDVEPSLDDIGHGSDALMARTRLVSPGNQATTSTGLNYLLAEDNDNMRVPFADGKSFSESELLEFNKAIKEKIKKGGRSNMPVIDPEEYKKYLESFKTTEAAEGGRIGFSAGGGSYDYGSMQHKINSVNAAYKRYKKSGGKKLSFNQFAPIWAAENFATGGRAGFSAGGGGRRAFLKLMATLGGGVAAAKSGILGLGGKEVGKQTAKEVVKSAGSGTPPPYFFKLVEKIKTLGDETIATQDKAIAKKYKDYVMEEDFAGNITIIKKGDENLMMRDGDVYMSYKVDEVPVKGKKGSTKVEEYEEYTARPDQDGKMKDIEPGVPDDVVQEGTMFDDNMTEFGKADGGRIGLFLGGPLIKNQLTQGKSLLKNMLKFMSKDGSHKKSPADILKMLNPKQFQKLLNNPKYQGQVSSEAPEGLDKIIQDMIGKTKTDRSDMVGDIISASRNIKKVDDDIKAYKLKIYKDMLDRDIDPKTAEQFAETLALQVSKAAGKKSTPKITEQGLLELENIQKNLVTKDRKLQAQGGLTTMLGE
jgi:hypothetical protein